MNNLIQMILTQKLNQIPTNMMNQLETQLKRSNPQAYREFQQAKKDNVNPQEYLNKVVDTFNPTQKKQWQQMMSGFNQGINTK